MLFQPQRYKIEDQKGVDFIDINEIEVFLQNRPTQSQVQEAIAVAMTRKRLTLQQTATLLNAPAELRKSIKEAATKLKTEIYGNRIVLFAPLYVGNLCANLCNYCAFAANNDTAIRKTLTPTELNNEIDALADQGHKRLILVYGEHPKYTPTFIAENVKNVYKTGKIRRININAAPLSVEGFKEVHEAGIGTYQIFQESYNPEIYKKHHRGGKKADYHWRLTAFDRAMEAGVDDVGVGVLLGLNPNWKEEVMGLIRHTNHLEACFGVGPHTISFPRMTPALGAEPSENPISDEDFIFAIAVLRLAVPYTGLILTAREKPEFRDKAIEYGVSQIDGGTKLEIGGYNDKNRKGGAQFTITDNRSLSEIIDELIKESRIPSFCTACYRKGRTGEHFMTFSTSGHIKELCSPNAILTFAEFLEEYGTETQKIKGYELIEQELLELKNREAVICRLERIKKGERDLYF